MRTIISLILVMIAMAVVMGGCSTMHDFCRDNSDGEWGNNFSTYEQCMDYTHPDQPSHEHKTQVVTEEWY